jgi:hypothetical protein
MDHCFVTNVVYVRVGELVCFRMVASVACVWVAQLSSPVGPVARYSRVLFVCWGVAARSARERLDPLPVVVQRESDQVRNCTSTVQAKTVRYSPLVWVA